MARQRAQKVEVEETVAPVTVEETATPVESLVEEAVNVEETEADEVTVSYRGYTRVYTRKEHGDDFQKLAKSFAGKVNGTLV